MKSGELITEIEIEFEDMAGTKYKVEENKEK